MVRGFFEFRNPLVSSFGDFPSFESFIFFKEFLGVEGDGEIIEVQIVDVEFDVLLDFVYVLFGFFIFVEVGNVFVNFVKEPGPRNDFFISEFAEFASTAANMNKSFMLEKHFDLFAFSGCLHAVSGVVETSIGRRPFIVNVNT